MNKAVAELLYLRRIRQASVAVNVWQPEIIRDRQRQLIEHNNVPIEFRISSLEMELSLCEQQIAGFNKALRAEKRRLLTAEEELASVKYHPMQDFGNSNGPLNECRIRTKRYRGMQLSIFEEPQYITNKFETFPHQRSRQN